MIRLLQRTGAERCDFMSHRYHYSVGFGQRPLPAPVAEYCRSSSPCHAHDLSSYRLWFEPARGSTIGHSRASGRSDSRAILRSGLFHGAIILHSRDGERRTSESSEQPPGAAILTRWIL